MIARVLTVLVVGCLLAANPRQGGDKQKTDNLQGTWTIAAVFDRGGKRVAIKDLDELPSLTSIVIEGNKGVIKFRRDEDQRFAYKLDATTKPKQIDLVRDPENDKKTLLGIYELDGEILKICFVRKADGRPTGFKEPEGRDRGGAFELKRAKAK